MVDATIPDESGESDDGETTDPSILSVRAGNRDSMLLAATMRRPDGAEVAVKVRNLSPGGMMVDSPIGFARGEIVEAELRGIGVIGGSIVWVAGGRVGMAFDRQIDPRLARKRPGAGPKPRLVKASRTSWRPGLR